MADQDADTYPDAGELPLEPLPLETWHQARGARMVPFAGYSMPIQYEGIVAEHAWTRSSAGLFDVSHMGQLLLSGDDVAPALEMLLPSDIIGLGRHKVRYSLLLDENAGILDDLMVTARDDGYYLVVNGATKYDDIAHLLEHLPDGVTINHMADDALLALQGPLAVDALARVVPGVEALYFMEGGRFGDLWISRSGYTGEDGFEVSVPADQATALADALVAQPEVKPIGLGARDSLRLEAALPLYGHDLDPEVDPIAAGLSFAIPRRRREGGGFPGASVVQRNLRDRAPVKRVGLRVAGRLPAREGAEIFVDGRQIGRVTSGGFSPTLQMPIAMGYVASAHAVEGMTFDIEVRDKRLSATVVAMPFVPHRYHRMPTKGAAA